MNATVYRITDKIGVCLLSDESGDYVGECALNGETVYVLPQSVRRVQRVSEHDLEVADEATPQDEVDRMVMYLRRFRGRLQDFREREPEWAKCDLSELRLEALAAVGQMEGL